MTVHSKKILITGIDSFTGVYLKNEMESCGYTVFGLGITKKDNSMYYECDIRDKESLIKCLRAVSPDYIINLAGISYVPFNDVSVLYEINMMGVINLIEACKEAVPKLRKLIVSSTGLVYGAPNTDIVNESMPMTPVNHYGASKAAMENAVKQFFGDIPIIIVRPFNYTGPGQSDDFVIPKIVKHYNERAEYIELGNTSVIRDFSDVRFIVEVYRRLLESDAESTIINICSNRGYSINKILSYAEELSGHKLEVRVNPKYLRKHEIHRLIGDNSLLKKYIGDFDSINIHDTVKWMLDELQMEF